MIKCVCRAKRKQTHEQGNTVERKTQEKKPKRKPKRKAKHITSNTFSLFVQRPLRKLKHIASLALHFAINVSKTNMRSEMTSIDRKPRPRIQFLLERDASHNLGTSKRYPMQEGTAQHRFKKRKRSAAHWLFKETLPPPAAAVAVAAAAAAEAHEGVASELSHTILLK